FWLGDAFASGGSSGYDHKKMGITSKGAWESVKRHFREMGIDVTREKITVVGVGDMSGDVFGNGMLLSPHLKLQAAFSHLHIFIDPEPDPEKSYQERKRLFSLPQSSWADYNSALISKGGGVFDRKAKSISLTPEIKNLLEIHENYLTPAELITYILKASVDLIWFGGIGTFIKAKSESNTEVGDRANDTIRINGFDIRAKVIAEGANLAVTQLGRVEYAKNGGRINTDAIDNSAGVDSSDHEVNIKILLNQVMINNGLKIDKRNILLEEMTNDVSRLVLKDNFWQNQTISLAQSYGVALLDEQARFMRDLETEGILNRTLEGLPDETEITRRAADRQGFTRPELAVLLAYSKLALKHQLIQSEIPDLPLLHARLLSYFPERLQYAYREEIIAHPLRREITSTLLTNSIVNRMGITFVSEMKHQTGKEGADVARAYLVVRELLDLVSLWHDIDALEALPVTTQNELMLSIYQSVKRYTDWFLRFMKEHHSVEETVALFKESIDTLKEELSTLFTPQQLQTYSEKCDEYEHIGLSTSLSERLVTLEPLISGPDMVILSKDTKQEIHLVARVYFALSQQLGFDWLRKTARSLSGDTHWQQGAADALIEDLYATQKILAYKILTNQKSSSELFSEDGTLIRGIIYTSNIEATLFDLMNASTVDFAMMTVINQRLRALAQTS
ncbi:MAG: NAD-glutamate dehydrogenase, partial [Alphaproteobacteria bacterium]|nr:NAD-glutamate dehydrogenase [Alphaproteobacteria bacterium]